MATGEAIDACLIVQLFTKNNAFGRPLWSKETVHFVCLLGF